MRRSGLTFLLLTSSFIVHAVGLRLGAYPATPFGLEIANGTTATVPSGKEFRMKFQHLERGGECSHNVTLKFEVTLSGSARISCESPIDVPGSCGWYISDCRPLPSGNYTLKIRLMHMNGDELAAAPSNKASSEPLRLITLSARLLSTVSGRQPSKFPQALCSSDDISKQNGMWIAKDNNSDRLSLGNGLSMASDGWEWALPHCNLKTYHPVDIQSCFKRTGLYVLGASHARYLYKGIADELKFDTGGLKHGHRGRHEVGNLKLIDTESITKASVSINFKDVDEIVYLFMDATERGLQVFGADFHAGNKSTVLKTGKWKMSNFAAAKQKHMTVLQGLQRTKVRPIYLSNVAYPDTQRPQSRGYRNNYNINATSQEMERAFQDAGIVVPEIDAFAITFPRNDDVCAPGRNHYACECAGKGQSWPGNKNMCGPVGWVLNQVVLNSVCNGHRIEDSKENDIQAVQEVDKRIEGLYQVLKSGHVEKASNND